MKKVALFLNGQAPAQKPELGAYEKVFCADGAFWQLQKYGIKPDVISGDFDSLGERPSGIEIVHTPDQAHTDFEKALRLIEARGHRYVDVYGASGKEQDHFLGNLTVGYKFQTALELLFIDAYQTYRFALKRTTLTGVKGKTISLYPFPIAQGIVTEGLAYPLSGESLRWDARIGIRNRAWTDRVEIRYTEGDLLLFVER